MNKQPILKAIARRRFLTLSGGLVLGAPAAGLARTRDSRSRGRRSGRGESGLARRVQLRLRRALNKRIDITQKQYQAGAPTLEVNTDEADYTDYAGNFTKALPHNAQGQVEPSAYRALVNAARTGQEEDFEIIPSGGSRALANPQAAFCYSLVGADTQALGMPAAPALDSAWEAGEMVEVYWHAALRDVPFDAYPRDPRVGRALADMNRLSDFRGPRTDGRITPRTLFRGEAAGDLVGKYISQFLLMDVPYGAMSIVQRYRVPQQGDDFMVSFGEWLEVQNGNVPSGPNQYDPEPRYLGTGRDLGEYVHHDFSYQAYLNAANILLGMGVPTQSGNPYNSISNQGGFVTFGAADLWTLVAEIAHAALRNAWFHKWVVHRRLRPEAFGGLVHLNKSGQADYPLHPDVMNSTVFNEFDASYEEGLLPMAYPEGSPTHPAYPAGHATIAGACVTVLKAFFDPETEIGGAVEIAPGTDSTELRSYTGPETLRVGGELDKLASNISLGRDIAGVHWRTDGTEGMKLGEQVAVRFLKDRLATYTETHGSLEFIGFDGNLITL